MTKQGLVICGLVVLVAILSYCAVARAQGTETDGRYELFKAEYTLRIDTSTGKTWVLNSKRTPGRIIWEEVFESK